jgi:hypothetical protein
MDERKKPAAEKPDVFWNKVYLAFVLTTILVIAGLWAFSRYFD